MLGLLMVGTFNLEKDKLLDIERRTPDWHHNPIYQEGGNGILPTSDWSLTTETKDMSEEEAKEHDKKKSKLTYTENSLSYCCL